MSDPQTPPTVAEFLGPQPVAIYRHVDSSGELLYVGITSDPVRRWAQHRETSVWVRFVADTTVNWLKDRTTALRAEKQAIAIERPLFNVARPGGYEWERRKPIVEHQLAYLRTGVSGLFRRPRCAQHGQFHAACGPDADAWLEASSANDMAARGY